MQRRTLIQFISIRGRGRGEGREGESKAVGRGEVTRGEAKETTGRKGGAGFDGLQV